MTCQISELSLWYMKIIMKHFPLKILETRVDTYGRNGIRYEKMACYKCIFIVLFTDFSPI